MSKERPFRVFIGKHLSFRGQKVKVMSSDLPTPFDLSFRWIADWSSPAEVLVKI